MKSYRVEITYSEIKAVEEDEVVSRDYSWMCTVEASDEEEAEEKARASFSALASRSSVGWNREVVAVQASRVE